MMAHTDSPGRGPRSARSGVDLVLTPAARRIRWHHVLVRRRRWSRELDRLLGYPTRPYDPWADPEFLAWHTLAVDLAGVSG